MATNHAHHWLIPTPDGSKVVTARCKYCSATQEHVNSWQPGRQWRNSEGQRPSGRKSNKWKGKA